MALEKTLVLVKPDALGQGYGAVADIIGTYLLRGLRLSRIKYFRMTGPIFEKMYGSNKTKSWFWKVQQYYYLAHFLALELEGVDAVALVRRLNGATNPVEAEEGTIRAKYGEGDNDPTNAVHSSDSPDRALEELEIIFG
jgi:nucleoside-diphosphate kinase